MSVSYIIIILLFIGDFYEDLWPCLCRIIPVQQVTCATDTFHVSIFLLLSMDYRVYISVLQTFTRASVMHKAEPIWLLAPGDAKHVKWNMEG